MAETETGTSAVGAEAGTLESSDFSALLQKEFKPKSDRAQEAVENAVRLRLRPILMSTMTSIFGMLPLMLMPGSGTELYRGMASVIVGGMLVSAVFTLLLLPSLLRMNEEAHKLVSDQEGLPAQA